MQEESWLCGVMLVHVLGSSVQINGKSLLACSVQRLLLAGRPLAGKMTRSGPTHPANHVVHVVLSMHGLCMACDTLHTGYPQCLAKNGSVGHSMLGFRSMCMSHFYGMVSLSASPQSSHERARQKGHL